jgi:hypothetical protein
MRDDAPAEAKKCLGGSEADTGTRSRHDRHALCFRLAHVLFLLLMSTSLTPSLRLE